MFSRIQSTGVGVSVLIFAAGLWLGSIDKTSAQVPTGANPNMRFLLTAASDGGMFMVDTMNGDTWTLVMGNATPSKQWIKLKMGEKMH